MTTETQFKHTPGPWSHGVHFDGVNFTTNPTVNTQKGRLIELDATNFSKYGHSEQEANAKLIAAAPELLEAAIEFLHHIRHDPKCQSTSDKIYALIKKATE